MKRTSPLRPPPEYGQFRREKTLQKAKIWDGSSVWMAAKHQDVCQVLSDPAFSKVRTHPGFPETGPGGKAAATATKPTFVDLDAPEHTEQRAMIEDDFSPKNIQGLKKKISTVANQLIDQIEKQSKPVDLHTAYSLPVPTLVIYDMLGIPYEDHQRLEQWNAIRTNGSATAAQSSAASQDLVNYLTDLVSFQSMISQSSSRRIVLGEKERRTRH